MQSGLDKALTNQDSAEPRSDSPRMGIAKQENDEMAFKQEVEDDEVERTVISAPPLTARFQAAVGGIGPIDPNSTRVFREPDWLRLIEVLSDWED